MLKKIFKKFINICKIIISIPSEWKRFSAEYDAKANRTHWRDLTSIEKRLCLERGWDVRGRPRSNSIKSLNQKRSLTEVSNIAKKLHETSEEQQEKIKRLLDLNKKLTINNQVLEQKIKDNK